MVWLAVYLAVAIVMLVMCGAAIGMKPEVEQLLGAVMVAAFWPIVLPIMVGALVFGER